ncbi:MAG: NAD(P)H-hydrate epimerase [Pirellulaceae bacterium]
MPHALTRAEVRDVDQRAIRDYGMSGLVLMENAGRGCAERLIELGCRGPVAIVCGQGNNAGDGFVIARHLDLRGIEVRVLLLADPTALHGDAAANCEILRRSQLSLREHWKAFDAQRLSRDLLGAEWIVDALLGTGASGPPRAPWDAVVRLLNDRPARKLAIDLPSGLDCDTGVPADPTFRADHTCTLVARKIGFDQPAAAAWLGQVSVVEIGVPRKLLNELRYSSGNDQNQVSGAVD